jgi:peroxiredoxin
VVLPQACERMGDAIKGSKRGYPFPLLCDPDRAVIKQYGVWHPIGLDAFNVAHPACFLMDTKRIVRFSFVGRTQFARAPLERILATALEPRDVR